MKKLVGMLCLNFILLMVGCGGGGSGGSVGSVGSGGSVGSSSVDYVYSGKTAPATLTSSNSQRFFQFLFTGILDDSTRGGETGVPKMVVVGRSVALMSKTVSRAVASSIPVQGLTYGAVSGSVTYSGSVEENGTGAITLSYRGYDSGEGCSYDGVMIITINNYDLAAKTITDAQMQLTSLTITSPKGQFTMQGSIHQKFDIPTLTKTVVFNLDGRIKTAPETFRLENLTVRSVYNSLGSSLSSAETLTGRLYLGNEGYVDISQSTPLRFDYLGEFTVDIPNAGGPILFVGAAASKARFTPLSKSQLMIEVDSNGDDLYENTVTDLWSNHMGIVPP